MSTERKITLTGLRWIILFCLVVSISSKHLTAQAKPKKMIEINNESDQIILSDLNARFIQNFLKQDSSSHNKIIHRDFVCIESTGEIVNRERYLSNWATDFDNSGYLTFSYSGEVIRIFGDMALVTAKTSYTKIVDGQTVGGNTIYTDTYIKENGKWMCVQVQITPMRKTN